MEEPHEGHGLARLEVLEGLSAALREPQRLLELLTPCRDASEAALRLRQAFGVSQEVAVAMLDMQFRRTTLEGRTRIYAEAAALRGSALPAEAPGTEMSAHAEVGHGEPLQE